MRQTLKLGLMVLVAVALITAGIALALDDDSEPLLPTAVQVADDDAADDATIGERIRGEAAERIRDRLQPLVDETVIDEAQADAVAEHLAEGMGPRFDGRGHDGFERVRAGIAEIAEFIGMEPEELRDAIAEGATLDEILADGGVTAEELVDHLLDGIEERLGDAVADGRITEEQKAEALERAEEHLTDLVENGLPFDGPRDGRRGPHRGGPGFGGGEDASADA
jgi:hypothetical protein